MTSLANLAFPTRRAQLDINHMAVGVGIAQRNHMAASGQYATRPLGDLQAITAALDAWTNQDDDAHEPCSLTACRHPLHPGPCKGWKGTLHAVSPGTYKQIEAARVEKANARRVKRIAELKSQGKPIPRRLLDEIKPKPAPTTAAPAHNAHNVAGIPLGQVNQKADLAGGTAHTAGQSVSQAANVKPSTPLPLGPKKLKPTVAGRGPAFVITQPKVTDTYKLDKADKLTASDWAGLSDADKTTIRNELTAIKARGFGPQQTKADALLARLPAPGAHQKAVPGSNPGAAHQPNTPAPSATPGKVSLGQASKTPQLPAPAPSPKRATTDGNGITTKPLPGGSVSSTSVGLPNGYRITRDGMGYSLKHNGKLIRTSATQGALEQYAKDHANVHGGNATPPTPPLAPAAPSKPGITDQVKKSLDPSTKLTPAARLFIHRQMTKDQFDSLDAATQKKVIADLDHQIANGGGAQTKQVAQETKDRFAPGAPATGTPAAPVPSSGLAPAAPLPPNSAAHVHHAVAVARRTAPKATTAKTQTDAYGKLSKADFDSLPAAQQKTIRDDLANAKAKFLDPKKQQAASDLLDRFGSKHPAPAPAAAPAAPAGHPKGYSDPMQEAVKAASSGMISTDDILKTTGRLSPQTIGQLDDADRKKIIGRLAFIATHAKAAPDQKDRAAALKRIIEGGSPASTSRKWDHDPTLAELHAEEKTGSAKGAMQVADALIAADAKTMPVDARLKDLGALSKAQFDALPADQQQKITDALHDIHTGLRGAKGATVVNPAAEKALTTYTGVHPAVHLTQRAEADFNAGKIDAAEFYNRWLTARVAAGGSRSPGTPGQLLDAESKRIAEKNTKLPLWLRATMIDSPYGSGAYYSIGAAGNRFNWEDAPRLSSSDITAIFRGDVDDLANSNPVHREAVIKLREHLIMTGLRGQAGLTAPAGSPWSDATRGHVVDNLLHVSSMDPEVPAVRLKEFRELSPSAQARVTSILRQRINAQSSPHAKTGTYIALRELENQPPLSGDVGDALRHASQSYATSGKLEAYRKLPSGDYANFPPYVQDAIQADLKDLQARAESRSVGQGWTRHDNPFKVMPAALAADLKGDRTHYSDRDERTAVDFAKYGTKIIGSEARITAYGNLKRDGFEAMPNADQAAILDDLDKIQNDSALTYQQRYAAKFVEDFTLTSTATLVQNLDANQVLAIGSVNPNPQHPISESTVIANLSNLDQHAYNKLDKPYRDAIDERIKTLPAGAQQSINAELHPGLATNTPAGFTPTAGTVNAPIPPHVQTALDTIYGVHPKAHTMAHQLSAYGALRGGDFNGFNGQEQGQLLGDLSFIATTAKGPSADKAKKLIDRFTPPGTPAGQVPTGAIVPPVNAVAGQTRYANPLKGLAKAKDSGQSGDGWFNQGGQRVWGKHGAAGLMLQHVDPQTGEKRYLMVQRGPAISDPGKWTFPGGASDSKETPHEGATRETIEELGLKDDVFKDALVHGDHTFSIPGSNWKYTSVAAQVPTMIQPNLTTAHARAETSDAKWMTIDEIRALDKAGSLHHPIAGGKLEQNVISLYPTAGTGVTLGQAARPGPVSKRLGRLTMPAGGRQAPANAWTAPHKPSKGKDLIGDKAATDAMRQKLKADRKLYDGKTADGRLAAIGAMQGFDDTPTVVDKKEMDRLLATGDYIEAWRGVTGAGGYGFRARSGQSGGKTAAEINDEMRSGPAYYGKGIFGNGYYLATQKRVAQQYADNTKGSIVRILIPKSAVTQTYDQVKDEAFKNPRTSQVKGGGSYGETSTFYDPGRYAAAKGLDGIEIRHHHRSPSGGAGHVAQPGQPAFNWLNRSVLILQKEPS